MYLWAPGYSMCLINVVSWVERRNVVKSYRFFCPLWETGGCGGKDADNDFEVVLKCPWTFLWTRVWGEVLVSLASKVRMCGNVCGGGEHQSMELQPTYFTLPRGGIGMISQEASEQSLALGRGSLMVKLKHACILTYSWVGVRKKRSAPPRQTSALPL